MARYAFYAYLLINIPCDKAFVSIATSALGRRLVSAGRRFQSMGQYGQGELQRVFCIFSL